MQRLSILLLAAAVSLSTGEVRAEDVSEEKQLFTWQQAPSQFHVLGQAAVGERFLTVLESFCGLQLVPWEASGKLAPGGGGLSLGAVPKSVASDGSSFWLLGEHVAESKGYPFIWSILAYPFDGLGSSLGSPLLLGRGSNSSFDCMDGMCLAVWEGNGDGFAFSNTILGMRFLNDGTLLDPVPLVLHVPGYRPGVIAHKKGFFIHWQNPSTTALDLLGLRMSREGGMLDAGGVSLVDGLSAYPMPQGAANDTQILLFTRNNSTQLWDARYFPLDGPLVSDPPLPLGAREPISQGWYDGHFWLLSSVGAQREMAYVTAEGLSVQNTFPATSSFPAATPGPGGQWLLAVPDGAQLLAASYTPAVEPEFQPILEHVCPVPQKLVGGYFDGKNHAIVESFSQIFEVSTAGEPASSWSIKPQFQPQGLWGSYSFSHDGQLHTLAVARNTSGIHWLSLERFSKESSEFQIILYDGSLISASECFSLESEMSRPQMASNSKGSVLAVGLFEDCSGGEWEGVGFIKKYLWIWSIDSDQKSTLRRFVDIPDDHESFAAPRPFVATDGSETLVLWGIPGTGDTFLWSSETDEVLPFPVAGDGVALAGSPGGYLFARESSGNLFADVLDKNGKVVSPGKPFPTQKIEDARAVWDGSSFLLAWVSSGVLSVARISVDGTATLVFSLDGVHRVELSSDQQSGKTLLSYERTGSALGVDTVGVFHRILSEGPGQQGAPCASGDGCLSGHCVDGVCCDGPCGGGAEDCIACSVEAGAILSGTCSPITPGKVCRPAKDPCDLPELCDSGTCPPDSFLEDGASCHEPLSCKPPGLCQGGTCIGGDQTISCPTFECQTTLGCDTSMGACLYNAVPDGTPCSAGECFHGNCALLPQGGAGGGGAGGGGAGGAGSGGAGAGDAGAGGAGWSGGGGAGAGGMTAGSGGQAEGAGASGDAGTSSFAGAAGSKSEPPRGVMAGGEGASGGACGCRQAPSGGNGWWLAGVLLVARKRRRSSSP